MTRLFTVLKGSTILGAVGTSASVAPPTDIVNAVAQLLLAAIGFWDLIKPLVQRKGAHDVG
ncbi:hypothetical protein C3942_16915 [Solimonas fluminis]|uniref:Holin n=1 Tax=Solimonas fluminis TaxID=2086571 RepID=A0A2S5TCJ4_9GAMM|nr:hypothetical protein [Solimonas fluminis]PPE72730.1 hypothetical protein C3942_16915 [Solimonas fluminis]